MIDNDECIMVADAMCKYGGCFVKSLGTMIRSADHINRQKIKDTWPEYWVQYKNMAED